MKLLGFSVSKRRILILGATVLCLVMGAVLVYVSFFSPESNDDDPYIQADKGISVLKDRLYQRYFVEHIDVFFKEEGINGMVDRVVKAFAEEQITMFVCHSLAHDIGHYGGYPDNFSSITEFLSKKNLDFCGSGFMHGVEGQLANEPYPQNVEDLYMFCRLVLPLGPYYGGCYHGAGHSFMENTRNPAEALAQCDMLNTDGVVVDVSHCYRGVFSEHANYLHKLGKGDEELLAYCSSLSDRLQFYCAEELNGLELPSSATTAEIEEKLASCIDNAYTATVKRGCVHSVAGIATDHILGHGMEIQLPPLVLTFPKELKEEYMESTFGSFIKSAAYKSSLSLDTFCNAFTEDAEINYCRSLSDEFMLQLQ